MDGAKDEDIKTVCICQKGRELPYQRFKRLTDEIIILDRFSDILNQENQEKLIQLNTIIIAHHAFTAYLGYDNIEKNYQYLETDKSYEQKNVCLIETSIIF